MAKSSAPWPLVSITLEQWRQFDVKRQYRMAAPGSVTGRCVYSLVRWLQRIIQKEKSRTGLLCLKVTLKKTFGLLKLNCCGLIWMHFPYLSKKHSFRRIFEFTFEEVVMDSRPYMNLLHAPKLTVRCSIARHHCCCLHYNWQERGLRWPSARNATRCLPPHLQNL